LRNKNPLRTLTISLIFNLLTFKKQKGKKMNELYSFLPIVVVAALLGFTLVMDRKGKTQSGKWNDYVR